MKLGFKPMWGLRSSRITVRPLWVLDSFPVTTNYHKLLVMKGHEFILSQFWRLRVQNHFTELNSECGQGWLLLEALGENLLPCLFQLLEDACTPLLMTSSPRHYSLLLSLLLLLLPPLTFLAPAYKDPCDYI